MVFAFAIEHSWKSFFFIYCTMPIFIFLLTYTLALRERDTKLHIREIIENIIKSRR